jgi:hypothetical protein
MAQGLILLIEIVHGVFFPCKYGPRTYFIANFIPLGPISQQDSFYGYISTFCIAIIKKEQFD